MKIGNSEIDDFILYILIGIVLVAFGVWWGFHAVATGGTGDLPMNWIWTLISAALIGSYTTRPYWSLRGRPRFWFALLIWLSVHFLAYLLVFGWLGKVPLLLSWLFLIPESLLVSTWFEKVLPNGQRVQRHRQG